MTKELQTLIKDFKYTNLSEFDDMQRKSEEVARWSQFAYDHHIEYTIINNEPVFYESDPKQQQNQQQKQQETTDTNNDHNSLNNGDGAPSLNNNIPQDNIPTKPTPAPTDGLIKLEPTVPITDPNWQKNLQEIRKKQQAANALYDSGDMYKDYVVPVSDMTIMDFQRFNDHGIDHVHHETIPAENIIEFLNRKRVVLDKFDNQLPKEPSTNEIEKLDALYKHEVSIQQENLNKSIKNTFLRHILSNWYLKAARKAYLKRYNRLISPTTLKGADAIVHGTDYFQLAMEQQAAAKSLNNADQSAYTNQYVFGTGDNNTMLTLHHTKDGALYTVNDNQNHITINHYENAIVRTFLNEANMKQLHDDLISNDLNNKFSRVKESANKRSSYVNNNFTKYFDASKKFKKEAQAQQDLIDQDYLNKVKAVEHDLSGWKNRKARKEALNQLALEHEMQKTLIDKEYDQKYRDLQADPTVSFNDNNLKTAGVDHIFNTNVAKISMYASTSVKYGDLIASQFAYYINTKEPIHRTIVANGELANIGPMSYKLDENSNALMILRTFQSHITTADELSAYNVDTVANKIEAFKHLNEAVDSTVNKALLIPEFEQTALETAVCSQASKEAYDRLMVSFQGTNGNKDLDMKEHSTYDFLTWVVANKISKTAFSSHWSQTKLANAYETALTEWNKLSPEDQKKQDQVVWLDNYLLNHLSNEDVDTLMDLAVADNNLSSAVQTDFLDFLTYYYGGLIALDDNVEVIDDKGTMTFHGQLLDDFYNRGEELLAAPFIYKGKLVHCKENEAIIDAYIQRRGLNDASAKLLRQSAYETPLNNKAKGFETNILNLLDYHDTVASNRANEVYEISKLKELTTDSEEYVCSDKYEWKAWLDNYESLGNYVYKQYQSHLAGMLNASSPECVQIATPDHLLQKAANSWGLSATHRFGTYDCDVNQTLNILTNYKLINLGELDTIADLFHRSNPYENLDLDLSHLYIKDSEGVRHFTNTERFRGMIINRLYKGQGMRYNTKTFIEKPAILLNETLDNDVNRQITNDQIASTTKSADNSSLETTEPNDDQLTSDDEPNKETNHQTPDDANENVEPTNKIDTPQAEVKEDIPLTFDADASLNTQLKDVNPINQYTSSVVATIINGDDAKTMQIAPNIANFMVANGYQLDNIPAHLDRRTIQHLGLSNSEINVNELVKELQACGITLIDDQHQNLFDEFDRLVKNEDGTLKKGLIRTGKAVNDAKYIGSDQMRSIFTKVGQEKLADFYRPDAKYHSDRFNQSVKALIEAYIQNTYAQYVGPVAKLYGIDDPIIADGRSGEQLKVIHEQLNINDGHNILLDNNLNDLSNDVAKMNFNQKETDHDHIPEELFTPTADNNFISDDMEKDPLKLNDQTLKTTTIDASASTPLSRLQHNIQKNHWDEEKVYDRLKKVNPKDIMKDDDKDTDSTTINPLVR